MNTYSANSLKVLNNSKEEFKRKYIDKTELLNIDTNEQILGNKFHNLICYYLKNFEITKFENSLPEGELRLFERIKNSPFIKMFQNADEKYAEQPFYIIENDGGFSLTGRFDAVFKKDGKYTILDWKTKNLPKDPDFDIQTVVYMFCASKLFQSENIEMIYYSIFDDVFAKTYFMGGYFEKIREIVLKNH